MTYYIDFKPQMKNNLYTLLKDKLLFKFEVINVDNNKKVIHINKKYINKRAYKKVENYFEKYKYEELGGNVVVAKEIQVNYHNDILYIPQTKSIMMAMICEILKHIENIVGVDFRSECIDIASNYDSCKDVLLDVSKLFKSVNIVTTKIGNMRRMENKMQDENIIMTISNNRRKALKRSKILVNLDFDNDILSEFEINRNCIIININKSKINLNSKFHGSIIDSVSIDFDNRYNLIEKQNYNLDYLYSSYLEKMNYKEKSKAIAEDNCKIINLHGYRGIISRDELVDNFTNSAIKLDKSRKKD